MTDNAIVFKYVDPRSPNIVRLTVFRGFVYFDSGSLLHYEDDIRDI